MKKPVPPCLDCNKRFIGCHNSCHLYINYRSDLEIWSDLIKTAKQLDSDIKEIELSRFKPYFLHKLRKDKNRSGF